MMLPRLPSDPTSAGNGRPLVPAEDDRDNTCSLGTGPPIIADSEKSSSSRHYAAVLLDGRSNGQVKGKPNCVLCHA